MQYKEEMQKLLMDFEKAQRNQTNMKGEFQGTYNDCYFEIAFLEQKAFEFKLHRQVAIQKIVDPKASPDKWMEESILNLQNDLQIMTDILTKKLGDASGTQCYELAHEYYVILKDIFTKRNKFS